MTVISRLSCHASLRRHKDNPFFPFQSHFREEIDCKRKISPNFNKIGYTNGFSMNGRSGEDVMNYTEPEQYEIVTSDAVDVKNAVRKIKLRVVGRRKNGQQKGGKEKKGESGNGYGRKNGGEQKRRASQGNGSSGMEGSGEGSGNGDESSDDEDDNCDDGEDGEDEPDEEEEEEEEDDDEDEMEEEVEEDTDNVSPMVEDDIEETTNGCVDSQQLQRSLELKRLEFENPGPKVASGTLALQSSEKVKENTEEEGENAVESVLSPALPGTPVTLSGVIWKETMGGVLVVDLKWRNKTYCGSLIDYSRHGWATPRNLDVAKESNMSTSKRGKGRKGKHKGSAYTGNPLSPKMTGNGKRGSRFHHNKGKHGKDSVVRPRIKRGLGSDNTEEGTRTRRRSCTVKTSLSPSPSPTPLIECPERNCNKKYKHINGLRYHQAHAHLDSVADPDEKDSDDEDETKPNGIKEPSSVNSKSSSSDDIKPLSRRKAKNQKGNKDKNTENVPVQDSVENEEKTVEVKEETFTVANIKVEPEEHVKTEKEIAISPVPNIIQEAAKIIFDEPAESEDITCDADVHPGIFARMTSQPMIVSSQPGAFKYVGYESESIAGSKSNDEVHEMDVTVKDEDDSENHLKEEASWQGAAQEQVSIGYQGLLGESGEEVIDEGNAGVGKIPCSNETEEMLKLDSVEECFSKEKSQELTMESVGENDKVKWLTNKDVTSLDGNEINQYKADTIRSLPGYQHFRLSSNNFGGSLSQNLEEKGSKTLTFESRVLETKEAPESIAKLNWNSGGMPRQQGTLEKQENIEVTKKPVVWKMHGAPSTSSASFQLSYESTFRPGYISVATSKKPSAGSVVTTSTTWVPEVHPAVSQKTTGGSLAGQEVVPEKPLSARETRTRPGESSLEQEDDEKSELGKSDEERPKASFSGKPGRAVGVAHPFNAEKSEGEYNFGSLGSFSSDPGKVLYSTSSSPKISHNLTHPEAEVKKVRVEKTLEVPVGEVIPVAKSSRSAVTSVVTRDAVIVGSEGTEHYSGVLTEMPDNGTPQLNDVDLPPRDLNSHNSYLPAVAERSSPWRPALAYSPPTDSVARPARDSVQRRTPTERSSDSPSRKTTQRSPLREGDRGSPIRGSPSSYTVKDPGIRTSEKDTSKMFNQRATDQRVPFMNFEERFARGEKNIGRSSEKDTSGPLDPVRGTGEGLVYRGSDRRSPHREVASASQLREYDRSPHRDISRAGQRSPGRERPEGVPGASYRDTSPNPSNRDIARHSPYKVKSRDGERRRDARSPERKSYRSEGRATKDGGESSETQRRMSTDKFPRMSNEEAMMLHLRQHPLYQYQTMSQDSAAREAMDNYMMYFGRFPAHYDARFMPAYPMMSSQMPLLLQPPAAEAPFTKEERPKEVPEEARSKSGSTKSENPRNRATAVSESTDIELVASKRHLDASGPSGSKGTEKAEYEATPHKRTKANEGKDVQDIEGSRMQFKKLEQQVLQQAYQQKMDAFNQLQTETSLKQKAEEKRNVRSKGSSASSSRVKPGIDSRSKKEDSVFSASRVHEKEKSHEEMSRLSPAARHKVNTTGENVPTRTSSKNSEDKSPPSGSYQGFLTGQNLPANHGLSNSYEMSVQGFPPFIMSPSFQLPPGIMMSNPLRGADPKREASRSSSLTTTDRGGRTKEDEGRERETREYSAQTKNDIPRNNKNNSRTPPPSSKPDLEKERDREGPRRTKEFDEEKQRTSRDKPSQGLPSNLAFRRGNMSGIDGVHFNQARLMYPPPHGNFRTSFDPYSPYSRK